MVIMQDSGMRPDEVFPMRIEDIHWGQLASGFRAAKPREARRFVAMSDRMEEMLRPGAGTRTEGWVFPSSRSASGHLTTIAKGFQSARARAGLDRKLVPYSPGTPTEPTRWTRPGIPLPLPTQWDMWT